jgi:hypothetical protein
VCDGPGVRALLLRAAVVGLFWLTLGRIWNAASVHAKDFGVLQGLLAETYPDRSTRPLVIGPDTTGRFFPLFSAIFNRKMQKLPPFCVHFTKK